MLFKLEEASSAIVFSSIIILDIFSTILLFVYNLEKYCSSNVKEDVSIVSV